MASLLLDNCGVPHYHPSTGAIGRRTSLVHVMVRLTPWAPCHHAFCPYDQYEGSPKLLRKHLLVRIIIQHGMVWSLTDLATAHGLQIHGAGGCAKKHLPEDCHQHGHGHELCGAKGCLLAAPPGSTTLQHDSLHDEHMAMVKPISVTRDQRNIRA